MDDEVMASAAKRKRTQDYPPLQPGNVPDVMSRYADDVKLAEWALPLLDETAIDFTDGTWQQSIGFGEPTINGWPLLFDNDGCDPIEMWLDYDGKIALLQSNSNDHVLIGTSIKTRGQLRGICHFLSIPLTEKVTP